MISACSRKEEQITPSSQQESLVNVEGRDPNRLIREKSPYLLQHAYNPVQWYPWGEVALKAAKEKDLPIFLSIGYSTCHWCHVMERESFENEEIAKILNENFVPIKVDREERPDIDEIYMDAVQALTGSGGWPLSVFLTPQLEPFYGGTYFPPDDSYGRPGFKRVLQNITDSWKNRRDQIEKAGGQMIAHLEQVMQKGEFKEVWNSGILDAAYHQLNPQFDRFYGGFGDAPKFPRSMTLSFLLRYHRQKKEPFALQMVEMTLDGMMNGGIYDQLGGGFHRYATDEKWLVPHFEKMLYDNALLAKTYLEAYQITQKPQYARIARETLDSILRDMTDSQGGFYSAEDADSEGHEGLFYLWTKEEIEKIITKEEAEWIIAIYGVTSHGNFEGKNILHLSKPIDELAEERGISVEELWKKLEKPRKKLFEAREKRIHPHKDDKILVEWNGLMISAMAYGYQVLGETRYQDAARRSAEFILSNLKDKEGKLLRRYREKEAGLPPHLNDYAFFIQGLIDLYESTLEPHWLKEAMSLNQKMLELFWDSKEGGLFSTIPRADLIVRHKDAYDGAIPSGNSMAALNLLRLSEFTNDKELRKKAEAIFNAFGNLLEGSPSVYPQMLCAVDFAVDTPKEIVIAGEIGKGAERLVDIVYKIFIPNKILLLANERLDLPILKGKKPLEGKATAYVCENFTCDLPTTDPNVMKKQLLD
ncbi:MAG: thioredoxin domain-containing protein [Deltaproteobacteria bacterium]|nr:thioredoxin domain-containing protein [Deltaproteobacteria bacterium]